MENATKKFRQTIQKLHTSLKIWGSIYINITEEGWLALLSTIPSNILMTFNARDLHHP
jgi:hypothetical protein